MRLPYVCFLLFVLLFVFLVDFFLSLLCPFLATMSYFLAVLCLFSLLFLFYFVLRNCSRFNLVWLCLSCDHAWIRSGSVNVRQTTNNNFKQILIIKALS